MTKGYANNIVRSTHLNLQAIRLSIYGNQLLEVMQELRDMLTVYYSQFSVVI